VGSPVTKSVIVSNIGHLPLTVNSCSLSGSGAVQFDESSSLPVTLLYNQSTTINVTFDPSGNGVYEATLGINSSDIDTPDVNVPLYAIAINPQDPALSVSVPKGWDGFGDVYVGEYSEPVIVEIRNTGTTSLNIISIELSDGTNFIKGPPDCPPFPEPCYNCGLVPFTLSVGEYCYTAVAFAPSEVGPQSTALDVYAGMPFPAQSSISLSGAGLPEKVPHLQLTPAGYEFGDVPPRRLAGPVMMIINNTGQADLQINELSISNEPSFVLDPNSGAIPIGNVYPVTISPGQNRTFSIAFTPDDFGSFTTDLRILSNDPQYPKAYFSIDGTGYIWNLCDFDLDGNVDFADFVFIGNEWLNEPEQIFVDVAPLPFEMLDNVIDILDLAYFAENWLESKD